MGVGGCTWPRALFLAHLCPSAFPHSSLVTVRRFVGEDDRCVCHGRRVVCDFGRRDDHRRRVGPESDAMVSRLLRGRSDYENPYARMESAPLPRRMERRRERAANHRKVTAAVSLAQNYSSRRPMCVRLCDGFFFPPAFRRRNPERGSRVFGIMSGRAHRGLLSAERIRQDRRRLVRVGQELFRAPDRVAVSSDRGQHGHVIARWPTVSIRRATPPCGGATP